MFHTERFICIKYSPFLCYCQKKDRRLFNRILFRFFSGKEEKNGGKGEQSGEDDGGKNTEFHISAIRRDEPDESGSGRATDIPGESKESEKRRSAARKRFGRGGKRPRPSDTDGETA